MRSLLRDKRVSEVGGEGMDEGRFFVHLKEGFDWNSDPHNIMKSKSFGSVREAREGLKGVTLAVTLIAGPNPNSVRFPVLGEDIATEDVWPTAAEERANGRENNS